jgi:hypothetical protein
LKCKPLEVRYLLAPIDWIGEFNSWPAWTGLELQDFSDWRRHSLTATPVKIAPSPATPSTPPASSSSPNKEVADFSKSIKRSLGDYTELSNNRHFHKWYASMIVTARVHKLEDIINPNFSYP